MTGRKIWQRRFGQINNFEKYSENGIVVLKIFLNVSREEQRRRFLACIDEPAKNWRFLPAEAKNRLLWDQYMEACEDCFSHTSTAWPWYVVPTDQKAHCCLLVAFLIYQSLEKMKLEYPPVGKGRRAELPDIRTILKRE